MILGNFLKYLFFPYINYLKIILPEHSIDYAWFEQELLLTLWLILLRFFLQNILKSKPICIITDLYHFLIRHTYFSLSLFLPKTHFWFQRGPITSTWGGGICLAKNYTCKLETKSHESIIKYRIFISMACIVKNISLMKCGFK